MDTGPHNMPSGVLAAAIPVLIYSSICLLFGLLLITVLCKTTDGLSYVLLFAIATTCTTLISIVQQSNYIANWHLLRVQQFEQSMAAKGNPALALGPLSRGFNADLFWIILYFYNVDSVVMLFWSIALVFNVWNLQPKMVQRCGTYVGSVSKVLAVVIPAVFSGLRSAFRVNAGYSGTLVLINIVMIVSLAVGAVCVILILIRYLSTRVKFGSHQNCTRSSDSGMEMPRRSMNRKRLSMLSTSNVGIDSWLVLRFTIAFAILSGFEIFLIFFEINRYHKIKHDVIMEQPDFSNHASIQDIVNYLPGVTASLLAFFLFGTTSQHRAMYISMFSCKNRLNRRSRASSGRVSGTFEEWGRLEAADFRLSQRHFQNSDIPSRSRNHDLVPPQIFITDESSSEPKRSSIGRILGLPHPLKEIGILDDCESTISSPAGTIHGVPSVLPT